MTVGSLGPWEGHLTHMYILRFIMFYIDTVSNPFCVFNECLLSITIDIHFLNHDFSNHKSNMEA